MSEQKQELRLKIKKLKYKIDKEEKTQAEYTQLYSRLKRFEQEKLCMGKILKKINFLLSIKGMALIDWLRASPYDEDLQIDKLLAILQKMNIKLPRQQKNLLTTFMADQLCESITIEDFRKIVQEHGLQLAN